MKAPTQRHHLSYLDGIRGASALTVVIGHSANAAGMGNVDLFGFGAGSAVDVFMILSGYLMVYQAVQRKAHNDFAAFTKAFYIRRYFRIAPLYYLALAVAYTFRGYFLNLAQEADASLPSLFISNAVAGLTGSAFSVAHFLCHITFIWGFLPMLNLGSVLPDWTLTLEAQFYLVFPLLFLWLYRQSTFMPTLVLLGVCSVLSRLLEPYFGYYATVLPLKLDLFLAGMLLAWSKWEPSAAKILCVALAFLCVKGRVLDVTLCLILLCDYGREAPGVPWLSRTAAAANSILGCGVARFFADMSYGIYLIHVFILIPVLYLFCKFHWFLELSNPVRFLVLAAPVTILSTLVSVPLHYGVEQVGIRCGQYLIKKSKA
jgi:peptidoglycan/LPS O-acetylase OafA/YrhL